MIVFIISDYNIDTLDEEIVKLITNSKERSTTETPFTKHIFCFNTLVYYRLRIIMLKLNQGYSLSVFDLYSRK